MSASRLHELMVTHHSIQIEARIKFVSGHEKIEDATMNAITSELNEHLAEALDTRGFKITEIEDFDVVIA